MYLEIQLVDAEHLAKNGEGRAKWYQKVIHRANCEATNTRRTLEEKEKEHVVTLRGLVQQLKKN